jgi:hypothetical protein
MADESLRIVPLMTFLLFLASVAALECILHRDRPGSTQTTETKQNDFRKTSPHESPSGSGLAALSEAVDRQGHGKAVGTLDNEAAHKPGSR